MTDRVGILEWVDGTKPLKSLVEDEIDRYYNIKDTNILGSTEAARIQAEFLDEYRKKLPPNKQRDNGVRQRSFYQRVN